MVFFTVIISLTFGTLGGYALARSGFRYAFWILMLALVFRAMPHITLVSGYLLPFFEWNIWGILPTTIIVLVAINQPFTLWMLHSFFKNIPKDMDESAMVDGCTRFQAFWHVIIPVMWPGVITTGLFSFCWPITTLPSPRCCLSSENQTMIPAVVSFLGTTQEAGNVMFAVAAVVSATAPLFFLVMFFQRQIVSRADRGGRQGMTRHNRQQGADRTAARGALWRHRRVREARWPSVIAPDAEFAWAIRLGRCAARTRLGRGAMRPLLAWPCRIWSARDFIVMAGARLAHRPRGDWIGLGGNIIGHAFSAPWLGIPPPGSPVFLRYHEYLRIEGDQVVEMEMIWDIPQVMVQAGCLADGAAAWGWNGCAPVRHDGRRLIDRAP